MKHLCWPKTAKDPFDCAERGDVQFFKTVELDILLSARNGENETVLHVAAINGRLDCCEVIVERCIPLLYDQSFSSVYKDSFKLALHQGVMSGNIEITRFLITADSKQDLEIGGWGKIPNKRPLTMQKQSGHTALHLAVEFRNHGATKLLLEADRDFELLQMVDDRGRTCLHIAAMYEDHVLAELIMKARPDDEFLKMTAPPWGETALHIAANLGNLVVAKLLLEADDSNDLLAVVDSHQRTALHIALEKGNLDIVILMCQVGVDKQLLSMPDSRKNTPLHYAVKQDNLDMVKLICKAGLDKQLLSMPDSKGNTPLHLAVQNSNLEIVRLLIEEDMVIDYCVNNSNQTPLLMAMDKAAACDGSGSDLKDGVGGEIPNKRLLTMQNICHETALHLAVMYHNHGATKLLLEADRNFELLQMVDNDGRTCLHVAAKEDDYESVELIINAGPNNEFLKMMATSLKQTALHIAAFCGNLAVAKRLLEADHSNDLLAMVDSEQQTALHIAVEEDNLDMVRLMCKVGLDKQLLSMPDSQGNTPLHLAVRNCNLEIVRLLIERDMVIDYCANNSNQTPLLMAIDKTTAHDGSGSVSEVIFKLLLEKDPSQCTKQAGDIGWTPLHLAASYGLISVVEDIIRLCPDCTMAMDFHGQTFLHIAVKFGHLHAVKHLLETKDTDDGNAPLHVAISKAASAGSASDSKVKGLLEKGPSQSTDQMGDGGWTPLHRATSYGLNSVVKDIIRPYLDCVNTVDFHGRNILHVAAYHGHLDLVKHFLKTKETDVALLNNQDEDGNTPLHLAVYKGTVKIVRLLLKAHPVSGHSVNISQQTPYMMAMDKILLNEGECSKSDLKIIRMLLQKDPEQCTIRTGDMNWTYLHHATTYGHLILIKDIIKDIIKLCPDCPKLVDRHNQTFIHIAAKRGFVDVVNSFLDTKEIDDTILNAQDRDGNTPLHVATLSQNKRMTLCLLYDARVSKGIENVKKEKAIDLINFPYDEAKARVYSLGHQRDLKDQSSFDLLVAALIATVSFTAGITVPGGYVSDGANKGSAILLKATAFKVFIVSNNFALLFSLYTVFLNFSTRRLLKEDDIYYESKMGTFRTRLLLKKKDMIYQLNAATLCTLSAVYAMVVAFITGSYAVLANSDGLAITVCVSSCFFLILASHATWTMAVQYWRSKAVP